MREAGAKEASWGALFDCGCMAMVVENDFIARPCSTSCKIFDLMMQMSAERNKPLQIRFAK